MCVHYLSAGADMDAASIWQRPLRRQSQASRCTLLQARFCLVFVLQWRPVAQATTLQTIQRDVQNVVKNTVDDYNPNAYTVITLSLVFWGVAQVFVPWKVLNLMVSPPVGALLPVLLTDDPTSV